VVKLCDSFLSFILYYEFWVVPKWGKLTLYNVYSHTFTDICSPSSLKGLTLVFDVRLFISCVCVCVCVLRDLSNNRIGCFSPDMFLDLGRLSKL